jgi:predicted transcriptional regulator
MAKQPKGIVGELRKAMAQAERAGVTAYRIAQAAGVPRSQLTKLAAGRIVRLDTAERILAAIGHRLAIVPIVAKGKRTG